MFLICSFVPDIHNHVTSHLVIELQDFHIKSHWKLQPMQFKTGLGHDNKWIFFLTFLFSYHDFWNERWSCYKSLAVTDCVACFLGPFPMPKRVVCSQLKVLRQNIRKANLNKYGYFRWSKRGLKTTCKQNCKQKMAMQCSSSLSWDILTEVSPEILNTAPSRYVSHRTNSRNNPEASWR